MAQRGPRQEPTYRQVRGAEPLQVADSATARYLACKVSPTLIRNQKFLRDECALACWICGAAPPQAKRVVAHAVDPRLWSELSTLQVTALVQALEIYNDRYLAGAAQRALLEMVLDAAWSLGPVRDPDDIRNLVVVCRKHQRRVG